MTKLHPAYLIEGSADSVLEETEKLLRSTFCQASKDSSCFCPQCRKIVNRQHSNIVWLNPDEDYTTDSIGIVFEKIRFALDIDEHFFFVLPDAHLLSSACGNRMLKVIEEPPTGYHFVFLTNNVNGVLNTIISRCITQKSWDSPATDQHSLVTFFSNPTHLTDVAQFEQELKKHSLTNQQAQELMYELLNIAQQKLLAMYNQGEHKQAAYFNMLQSTLSKRLKKPPQSGSSALFLKMLYLDLDQQRHTYEKTGH